MDWLGAGLTFLGLAGPVLALIRLPEAGWSSPQVWATGLGGVVLLVLFVLHERRARTRWCRSACSGGATSPSATCRPWPCTAG